MARDDQKMRSEAVRQAIIETAYEMGIEEGFEAVTVRKIISKMKYSTGVVYHHFKDKQEIIDAIEEAETSRLRAAVSATMDESKDFVTNMGAVFHRIMVLAYEEPEKYNLIVLHKYARRSPEPPPWVSYISGNLEKCMREGTIREMDAEKAAFAIWSSFLGFNLMISRHKVMTFEEAEEMFAVQLDVILRGIIKCNKEDL